MLSNFVGAVDFNSALVLVAAFVCFGVIATSLIVKRRSRLDINNEHELAKMKQESEERRALFALETERAYKFKQIDQNLITSHRKED